MKKVGVFLLSVLLAAVMLSGCTKKDNSPETDAGSTETAAPDTEEKTGDSETGNSETGDTAAKELHHAQIDIKDYGVISVELDASEAPISVENFMKLANEGFYDGLTFHRIIKGFMMQGGDGGECANIKGEFKNNGVENNISHVRGVISMARANDYDSASSQFFIMHQDGTYLDGDYAAFGHVTEGMDIVDKICEEAVVTDNNGSVAPENQPVINTIKIID